MTGTKKEYCLECHKPFEPRMSRQYLCDDCTRYCTGCSQRFNPIDKLDHLCISCNFKAVRQEGTCSWCGDYSTALDQDARCLNCPRDKYDTTEEVYKCSVCNNHRVSIPYTVCKTCAKTAKVCSDCKTSVISSSDYLCEDCKNIRDDKWN